MGLITKVIQTIWAILSEYNIIVNMFIGLIAIIIVICKITIKKHINNVNNKTN